MRITRANARRLGLDFDALMARARVEGKPTPAVAIPGEPRLLRVTGGRGKTGRWWEAVLTDWKPCSDNLRARGVRAWSRAKKRDREVVRSLLVDQAGIPPATGRRRVDLLIEKRNGRGLRDGSNVLKSWHDALTNCGLLIDDSDVWLESRVRVVVNREIGWPVVSTIRLEEFS